MAVYLKAWRDVDCKFFRDLVSSEPAQNATGMVRPEHTFTGIYFINECL